MHLIFLRHAETQLDSSKPARYWCLTSEGEKLSHDLADSEKLGVIDAIYVSTEMKTTQTALPYAKKYNLALHKHEGLDELNRGEDSTLTTEEYYRRVQNLLSNPPKPVPEWESPLNALSRFNHTVRDIRENDHNRVLIVSHGLVLILFFASLFQKSHNMFSRWQKLEFLSWGVVVNDEVLVDIVH